MSKIISSTQKAYLAGFLDGDGSIYVRVKPNPTYKYGFQIAPSIILFQSAQDKVNFFKVCTPIGLGYMRERRDGILEYTINRKDAILKFLQLVQPYAVMKSEQIKLMIRIFKLKERVHAKKDFEKLVKMIDKFRELNYSKKRKRRILTP